MSPVCLYNYFLQRRQTFSLLTRRTNPVRLPPCRRRQDPDMDKTATAVELAAAIAFQYGLSRLLAAVVTHAESRETREVGGPHALVPLSH